jgi:hypothetical protein
MSRIMSIVYSAAFTIFVVASGSLFAAPGAVSKSRTLDGHPDLSGIWQITSTANWDLPDHPAAAGPFYAGNRRPHSGIKDEAATDTTPPSAARGQR